MNALEAAQRQLDAWNRHDAKALVALSGPLLKRLCRSLKRRLSELFRRCFGRIGPIRISDSGSYWGQNLFDDLDKLENPARFGAIFDVGANKGEVSKSFLRHFPNAMIYAFEPVESTFQQLKNSLSKDRRARLHRLAASDVSGSAIIRTFRISGFNTMVSDLHDGMRANQISEEKIQTRRLDQMMSELGIKKLDLLKIDVEGFEKHVLLGCGDCLRPDVIRYIYFECHVITELTSSGSNHTQLAEMNGILTTRGYRFITLYTEAMAVQEPMGSYMALYGPLTLTLAKSRAPLIG